MKKAILLVALGAFPATLGCASKPRTYELKELLASDRGWGDVRPGTLVVLDGAAATACEVRVGTTAEEADATGADIAGLEWTKQGKVWEVVELKAIRTPSRPDVVLVALQEKGGGSAFWIATNSRKPSCLFFAD